MSWLDELFLPSSRSWYFPLTLSLIWPFHKTQQSNRQKQEPTMAFPPDLESYHHDRNITNPSINQSITSTTQHPTEHLSLPAFRTQHERCSTLPVNKQKLNRHTRISAIQLLTQNQNSAASSPRPLNTSPVNLHSHPPDPHRLPSNRVQRTAARKTQANHSGYFTRPGVQSLL